MSDRIPRFSLLPPSVGDRLLSAATTAKIELHRWPAEPRKSAAPDPDNDPADAAESGDCAGDVECNFELKGSLPLAGNQAGQVLAALLREFRAPRSPRQEGGAA